MKHSNLSGSPRISSLMDLMRALGGRQTPYEALVRYLNYLGAAYPDRAHMVLATRGLPAGQYQLWRFLGDDGVENIELGNPWEKNDLPIESGGLLSEIVQNRSPQLIHELDWADEPRWKKLLGPYRSLMAVPLLSERLPLNWSFMFHRDPMQFTPADVEESVARATLVSSLLDSMAVSHELAEAHVYIDKELERMSRVQRALLPDPIPEIRGLQIAASYETFGQVGGDLYDFISLHGRTERSAFFIADASGHGPSAAVAAAMVQATLHACIADARGPADLFQTLNRHLCQKRLEGSFVTAFLGFYEPSKRRLTYASAGHPLPLIRNRQPAALAAVGGPPLGVDDNARFDEMSLELARGETVVMYTDGISEARDPEGRMFGEDGIESTLRNCDGDATSVVEQLRESLMAHQRGTRPSDDQTIVAIHVRP